MNANILKRNVFTFEKHTQFNPIFMNKIHYPKSQDLQKSGINQEINISE